ncbi:MAG: hypothetical protein NXI12_04570 [Alphaproteobacteria bacterium]|nr:hypothetical protein [Alphaproteobacteria bacterium]
MLWLVWHMWVLLLLAFAGGVIAGWILRSRSDDAPEPAAIAAPAAAPEPEAAPPAPHVPAPEPKADGGETAAGNSPRVAAAFSAPEPSVSRDPEPAPAPAADPSPAKDAASDDLTAIKGLGPKAAEKLTAAGVTRFSQIAGWKAADIEKYDEALNARGRIARDDWVGQAKALSKG